MLSKTPGKILEIYTTDYVLFDLETTGLSTLSDEVVEISALKVKNGFIEEEFSSLVKPSIPISRAASAVNHISNKMVEDSPTFDSVLYDFIKFAGNNILVGHNIQNFDLKFIQRDSLKYFGAVLNNDYIDTLRLARIYLPELESHSLGVLATHYHLSTEGAHRALADCKINKRVFESLKKEMENPSDAAKAVKRCPKCGNVLRKRHGSNGDFFGCASFPDCRYTENI